jgi:hypothetical protein
MKKTMAKLAISTVAAILLASTAWADANTKVALVPGGPHPYFAA